MRSGVSSVMGGTGEHEAEREGGGDLKGLRVLVVEDEYFVALSIERALEAAGCQVVGPFGWLEDAAQAARAPDLDGAILDVHLHGELVSPIADRLVGAGVPVLFATAADASDLPPGLRKLPRLAKPLDPSHLLAAAAQAFKGPRARHA